MNKQKKTQEPDSANSRTTCSVIGTPIDVISWKDIITKITIWSAIRESRYICICNSHSVVTAKQNAKFNVVLKNADLSTPDGAPVAWSIRQAGHRHQSRINGPDLMWRYCESISDTNHSIYLYGGQPETLKKLTNKLSVAFPNLKIAGSYSPPFRNLSDQEDEAIVKDINESGAGVVWVSLGCPKQEIWMAEHKGRINATMIGVGAAFDYHAGTINRAPIWMQKNGLEWFHRLCSEPRRLWKRYLITNTLFIVHTALSKIRK